MTAFSTLDSAYELQPGGISAFDEMARRPGGQSQSQSMGGMSQSQGPEIRRAYEILWAWVSTTPAEVLKLRHQEAETIFRRLGITFAVNAEGGDPERIIPFDIIPRIIEAAEWQRLSEGLVQRVKALNAFITDVYGPQEILKAGVVPPDLVLQNDSYVQAMAGLAVPQGVYTHIAGIDVVRVDETDFYVLEDNVRTPSGVSYMLKNREVTMRLFPDLFTQYNVAPVDHYCDNLLVTLSAIAPPACTADPTVVIMTPGIYNSAYYEHCFLADQMGVDLVEGRDLFVRDGFVYMRTTEGPRRVDVIYKRIDDAFIDPDAFNPDSVLGVRGLMAAYRDGKVTLANAVGTGIADDKAIYTYVPDMVRFYLGEEPKLKNVPTWRCRSKDDLSYVLDHLDELVVKEVHGSGGYGMLIGPKSTKEERAAFAERLKRAPTNYIAQPTLSLSTCPTLVNEGLAPRHVDFRPFVLVSDEIRIVPGGLTRVALREGSLVVNSSQGGGTKDTWILRD